jgi:hypothetical protein
MRALYIRITPPGTLNPCMKEASFRYRTHGPANTLAKLSQSRAQPQTHMR